MNAKTFADNMIKLRGLDDSIRVITAINTEVLKSTPDMHTTNKKKQSIPITTNLTTSRFFQNVKNYLKNKQNAKSK